MSSEHSVSIAAAERTAAKGMKENARPEGRADKPPSCRGIS